MKNPNWTREQALACFNLYCRLPFGRMHSRTKEIVAFADAIGRTPSAVAMKLVNFASFDPAHQKRNVRGLSNASSLDREIWEEFQAAPNKIAQESEDAYKRVSVSLPLPDVEEPQLPQGPTEAQMTRPMRLVQNFFRRTVLASYDHKCCFCGLEVRALLNASHIIPWNVASEKLRADPRNGLCLCALHDRAFDRMLMSIDQRNRIVLSKQLKAVTRAPLHKVAFLDLEERPFTAPKRFVPDRASLTDHYRRFRFLHSSPY